MPSHEPDADPAGKAPLPDHSCLTEILVTSSHDSPSVTRQAPLEYSAAEVQVVCFSSDDQSTKERERAIQMLVWPLYSPGLNPIETRWAWMKNWISSHHRDDIAIQMLQAITSGTEREPALIVACLVRYTISF